jgi:hypothetical protein
MRLALLSILIVASALGQEPGAVSATRRETADVPGIPRVLMIGDSIASGYDGPAGKLLAERANVHHADGIGGPTTSGVSHIDKLARTAST